MKIVKVRTQMFRRELTILIGTLESANKYIKKRFGVNGGDYLGYDGVHHCFSNGVTGEKAHIIWLSQFEWTIKCQGLLMHEVFHYVADVMEEVGIKFCDESEEAFAYYYQECMVNCFAKLKPKKEANGTKQRTDRRKSKSSK